MRERELRRWGNAYVVVALLCVVGDIAGVVSGSAGAVFGLLILASITWLRADIAKGRA